MKIIAAIPARLDSTRFPKKMLADLNGLPVIAQTYNSVKNTNLFDEIIVATDSEEIEKAIKKQGGNVFRSIKNHNSGTDRIAEALEESNADIIVNIQGDEPFVNKITLQQIISCFKDKNVDTASAMQIIKNKNQITDPNFVKVVVDKNNFALYFSRSAIPFKMNTNSNINYYEHIGIYGFTKRALLKFYYNLETELENTEKVEAIRFLEMGFRMKIILTEYMGIEIDTKEDLEKAQKLWLIK